jgi:protein phosphatase methylesterase 1
MMLEYTLQRFPNKSIIIMGHSMGGSIAVKTVEQIEAMEDCTLKRAIKGLLVVDVVEGTAMDALPFME